MLAELEALEAGNDLEELPEVPRTPINIKGSPNKLETSKPTQRREKVTS